MRIIDSTAYYKTGDLANIVNRSTQQIVNWDKYSDILESQGKERLIPKATRINGLRWYTTEQVKQIELFAKSIKRGQMAEYSRTRMGQRGKDIAERMEEKAVKKQEEMEIKKQKEEEIIKKSYLKHMPGKYLKDKQ